jgi:GNAT superfamily N-acetyltransferase
MSEIKIISIIDADTAREVHALQLLAYRIEADLIRNDKIPYLTQGVSDLMRSEKETFLGYFDDEERIMGVFSYQITNDGVLDVHRFMVHPSLFRQGVASELLNHALENNVLRKIIAQTGAKNKPARECYQKNGIDFVCEIQVDHRTRLATFEKVIMSLEDYQAKVG